MGKVTELDIQLEKAEAEIDHLTDRIDFYRRKVDDAEWRIKQLGGSDPEEEERLLALVKQDKETIIRWTIERDHLMEVADDIGHKLRQAISNADTETSSEPDDDVKVDLKPKKPKPKM